MPADVLTALRDHLVVAGVVRKPSVAGPLPPLWLEKEQGVPAPGDGVGTEVGPTIVLGAYLTGGIAPQRYESWWRKPIVDVHFRAKGRTAVQDIQTVEYAISAALIDRVDFTMGGLYLVECEQWRALQRLGSDEQGYEFVSAYIFTAYRS